MIRETDIIAVHLICREHPPSGLGDDHLRPQVVELVPQGLHLQLDLHGLQARVQRLRRRGRGRRRRRWCRRGRGPPGGGLVGRRTPTPVSRADLLLLVVAAAAAAVLPVHLDRTCKRTKACLFFFFCQIDERERQNNLVTVSLSENP